MANIKTKDVAKLETWDQKELRKLRMTIKNRISAFDTSSNPKELSTGHPLFELEQAECKTLLAKVMRAEKNL